MPAAYTHLTAQLWQHELEDCMTLHQQQQQLAESRLRRHEFTTMDELLKENRDFVQSQRFYNVSLASRFHRRNPSRRSKTIWTSCLSTTTPAITA